MSKDARLAVEVPAPDRDKPGWVKVGAIAAVGFILGIAWPRFLGVRLGPAAPGSSAAASASASSQAGRAPEASQDTVTAAVASVASVVRGAAPPAAIASLSSSAPAPSSAPPSVTVNRGNVLSCKTSSGDTKKGKDCGAVAGIDELVRPRLRRLATCSGLEGQSGKLSVVVSADFDAGRLSYDIGKSTSLANADAVGGCLKTAFQGASAKTVAHTHARYTVAYTTMVGSAGAASSDVGDLDAKGARKERSEADASERAAKQARDDKDEYETKGASKPDVASGEALIAWEVALVRDTPKTGGLVGRLPRGTKVKVGSSKDGWYLVKFGDGFAHEGWVYRGAIGR